MNSRGLHWLAGMSPSLVVAIGVAASVGAVCARNPRESESLAEHDPSTKPASFSEILRSGTRRTFDEVAEYLRDDRSAADAEEAHHWLFTTARKSGWEEAAADAARDYLESGSDSVETRWLAGEVRVLAAARAGNSKLAIERFDSLLPTVRRSSTDAAIQLSIDLASQAQLAGDHAAARAVFERLPRSFFRNRQVEEISAARLAKLELAGEKAPEIGVTDLSGSEVSLDDFRGKVLLVDFWATDCVPCLAELPRLKRLSVKYQASGFEILGIGLDEQPEVLERFRRLRKLEWRMASSSTDSGATRLRYRARTIPSLFLIDRAGRIMLVDVRGRELEAAVERIMRSEDPE